MAIGLRARTDRSIVKRQIREKAEAIVWQQGIEEFKDKHKALWENRTNAVLRDNRIRSGVMALENQQKLALQERRRRLADMLFAEQQAYEQEMIDREETPQQRMDKMAVRAYELKQKREEERKMVVQEKLKQQWRSGLDELRSLDSQKKQVEAICIRDHQLQEKAALAEKDKEIEKMHDNLWHESYLAKVEREKREREWQQQRQEEQKNFLSIQIEHTKQKQTEEREREAHEQEVVRKQWCAQDEEETRALLREKAFALDERRSADAYRYWQQQQTVESEALEKQQDKIRVDAALAHEEELYQQENSEKAKARQLAVKCTEASKAEKARRAAHEAHIEKLYQQEAEKLSEKQYQKQLERERARQLLMEEVQLERGRQNELKDRAEDELKHGVACDHEKIMNEVKRLEDIEREREAAEVYASMRHQKDLLKQMDFKHAQQQQKAKQEAIDYRQAAITEHKMRRMVEFEKNTVLQDMQQTLAKRATTKPLVVAPWNK